MTRYYGLYGRHRDIDDKLHKAVHKSKHKIILDWNTCANVSFSRWAMTHYNVQTAKKKFSFLSCTINMTDSDLLDMHYFLTEDDDLGDDEFEEGFYIDLF